MVIFGIVVIAFLVPCFFYYFKKIKRKCYYGAVDYVLCCAGVFLGCVYVGTFLGAIISFAVGNVAPSESILVETRALEPVIAEGKEVFAIKNNQSYFYFTKSKFGECPLRIGSILLEERSIRFGGDIRTVNKYKIKPKGNLKWFFFSSRSKNELVLISKEDIL